MARAVLLGCMGVDGGRCAPGPGAPLACQSVCWGSPVHWGLGGDPQLASLPSCFCIPPSPYERRLCATLGSLDPDVSEVAPPFIPIDPAEVADIQLFSQPGQEQLLPLRELPASVVSDVLREGLSPMEAETRWKARLGVAR